MDEIILLEIMLPRLSFIPVCFTVWRKRDIYLKVISLSPQIMEVSFGSPRRKLREITFLSQLQILYKAIYDEELILKEN